MTDEEKQNVIAQARATLERIANIEPDPLATYRPHETNSDRWRREATADAAQRKAEQDGKLTEYQSARLRADLTNMVAAERSFLLEEFLPVVIAELRARITAEISEAVGQLGAETNVARAIDKSSNISELPSFLARKTK